MKNMLDVFTLTTNVHKIMSKSLMCEGILEILSYAHRAGIYFLIRPNQMLCCGTQKRETICDAGLLNVELSSYS